MRASHTLLSGAIIEFDAPFNLGDRCTNFANVIMDGEVRQLGSGPLSFAESAARRTLEMVDFEEEYSFQGGRLRFGSAPLADPVTGSSVLRQIAVWEGQAHSLKLSKFESSYLELMALLDQFTLVETATGLTANPKDSGKTKFSENFHPLSALKEISNLGLLHIRQLTDYTARSLPTWRGQQVRGGELYVDNPGTSEVNFYLVGESALTRIRPLPARGISESQTLEHVDQLLVEWK